MICELCYKPMPKDPADAGDWKVLSDAHGAFAVCVKCGFNTATIPEEMWRTGMFSYGADPRAPQPVQAPPPPPAQPQPAPTELQHIGAIAEAACGFLAESLVNEAIFIRCEPEPSLLVRQQLISYIIREAKRKAQLEVRKVESAIMSTLQAHGAKEGDTVHVNGQERVFELPPEAVQDLNNWGDHAR